MTRCGSKSQAKLMAVLATVAVVVLPQCAAPANDERDPINVSDARGPDDPRVCAEALCIGTRDVDVDGDGKLDRVQARRGPLTDNEPGFFDVAVTFASGGQRVSRLREDALAHEVALMGASDVNGDGRSDIFAIYHTGSHARSVRVLEYREGELISMRGLPDDALYIDSSDSSVAGFKCDKDERGLATFTISTASIETSDPASTRYAGEARTYKPDSSGAMNVVSSSPLQYDIKDGTWPQELKDLAGGHCAGIDVYPGGN